MNLPAALCLLLSAGSISGSDQFALCLKDIAGTYFRGSFVVVIYWTETERANKSLLFDEMPVCSADDVVKIFLDDLKWTVKVYQADIERKTNATADHRTWNAVLLLDGDIATDVQNLKRELKTSKRTMMWRSQGQILLIVRAKGDDDGSAIAAMVLESLWALIKACNVVVMIANGPERFEMYRMYPYTDECYAAGKLHPIDAWENGTFAEGRELFLVNGVTNMNGCPLRVGAFPNAPYVLDPVGDRINFTKGLDIKIVTQLSDYYNFTISYTTLPEGKFPYIIFDSEGEASGFHGMLQRQEIDMMIFGVRIHELRNMLADPLDSYAEDALVWVVPTPGRVPSWRNLGDAFTPTVWILFGLFFVLISVTLYIISNNQVGVVEHSTLRTYVSCLLSSLGVVLNNSVARPKGALLRMFMFMFSLYAINTNSAYQSSLIALLTNTRYEKPYETPMDAVLGGVKTYLFPSGNITYNQTDHGMWNVIFRPERHAFIEDFVPVLREIALEKTAMVMMAENVAKFEIKTKYMTHSNEPRALFLKEKFSLYKVTAYVSSGHPLRESFRNKVNQMVEGGLVGYWLNEVLLTSEHQFVAKQDGAEGAQPLTLQHLQGPFFILLISLLISLQVFCTEIVFDKVTKRLK